MIRLTLSEADLCETVHTHTFSKRKANGNCGDDITLHVLTDGEILKSLVVTGGGCVYSIGTAKLLCEHLQDCSLKEARKTIVEYDHPIKKSRERCILLPIQALWDLLDEIEAWKQT